MLVQALFSLYKVPLINQLSPEKNGTNIYPTVKTLVTLLQNMKQPNRVTKLVNSQVATVHCAIFSSHSVTLSLVTSCSSNSLLSSRTEFLTIYQTCHMVVLQAPQFSRVSLCFLFY